MANKKRLIDANALLKEIETIYFDHYEKSCYKFIHDFFKAMFRRIRKCPTVDAVSIGVHEQVRWERDIAMEQLEEHGISFGCTSPDVVKVVRCKDCTQYNGHRYCRYTELIVLDNDFCSYGERKDNES